MAIKKLGMTTIDTVVANIKKLDKTTRKDVFLRWNNVLDDLLDDDAFGTEGQLDPRGDRRDQEDEDDEY